VLALLRTSADEVLAVLPRELSATVEQRLRKFILRAKVRIDDVSGEFRVIGLPADAPPSQGAQLNWGGRRVRLVPSAEAGAFRAIPVSARTGNSRTSPRACPRFTRRPVKLSSHRCSISTC
jgi:hypothetical protein